MANSRCVRCTTHSWATANGGTGGVGLRQMADGEKNTGLRHHVARRVPVGGRLAHGRGQGRDCRAPRRSRASTISRADGRARTIATRRFSTRSRSSSLRHAKIAAFGSTRRADVRASADRNLQLLLRAETPVATVVGKTWDMHVREALRIPLNENLDILNDTIAFLKKTRRRGDLRRRAFLRRLFQQSRIRAGLPARRSMTPASI